MRPENAVGVGVLARDDALDLVCGRHALRPLRGDPASSVRRREREGIGIVNLPRSSGVLLHVTSLPGGRLGTHAFAFVDWLAAAGQTWWQVLPLAPPDRSGSPVHVDLGIRGLAGAARRSGGSRERRRDRRLPRRARLLDRRLGALCRGGRRRRPGALRARVERVAALRGRARCPPDRRHPALRRRRQRRPPRAPRALPARLRRGSPAGRARLRRPALGQSALRLARAAPPGLPLVDRAVAARVRPRRPGAHRPLPRLRRVLVDPRAGGRCPQGPLAARAGRRGVRRRQSASSASSP